MTELLLSSYLSYNVARQALAGDPANRFELFVDEENVTAVDLARGTKYVTSLPNAALDVQQNTHTMVTPTELAFLINEWQEIREALRAAVEVPALKKLFMGEAEQLTGEVEATSIEAVSLSYHEYSQRFGITFWRGDAPKIVGHLSVEDMSLAVRLSMMLHDKFTGDR